MLTIEDIKWINENINENALDVSNKNVVTLSDEEVYICKFMADKRYKSSRSNGIVDQRLDNSGEFLDLDGFGAEMAFCKRFNLYPDFTSGVKDFDCVTRKGSRVDIKYTKYENGRLLATLKKRGAETDVYVLVTGKFPTYTIVGYARADELLRDENITDLGHGDGFSLTQDKLLKLPY